MQALGAQISHMLKARGVEVIFGIPGVHNQEMYRGIEEAGLRHVLARHEQGAGFMADGYARATGRPGVCYVITGPGVCNILTPMGQAYSDSVPILVIASCLDETAARRGQLHQMLDQRMAAASACSFAEEARSAGAAYALIDRALAGFASARPRPAYVQVPIGLLGAAAPPAVAAATPSNLPRAGDAAFDAVLKALGAARRPIFIFGGGARGAAAAIPAILQQTGAASFCTAAARGLVPRGTALDFGATLARRESAAVLARSDLVVAVGTELAEVDVWRDDLGHRCPMVRIDLDPEVLGSAAPGDLAVHADAGAFLEAMAIAIPARNADRPPAWEAGEVAAFRARTRSGVGADYPGTQPAVEALQACLPDDVMIYSDMTQFAYAALEVWEMARPGHWHHPFGFGTLGYALPAAIGGAIGRPGLPTLAIAGDYGFQYTLPELATAVELGLPLPILVWDNGKLGAIEASMIRAQIAPNAVVAHNPDFGRLAEAYGALSARPATLDQMCVAVHAAFRAERPTLIRVTPELR